MNVLFLGDIVGKKGREVIRDLLPVLKKEYNPDVIIANAENSAHGKGITFNVYNELIGYGIDCLTMGNHTYSKREIFDHISEMDRMVTPSNHNQTNESDYLIIESNNLKIAVINILGEAFMGDFVTDQFKVTDELIHKLKDKADLIICDYHGETTAEKRIYVEYYKNKISAVLGTHTHVQTADERMIENTAFISDVGMCGPYDSIIGRDIDESITSKIYKEKTHYTVSEEKAVLCGCILEVDPNAKKVTGIKRIQIRPY